MIRYCKGTSPPPIKTVRYRVRFYVGLGSGDVEIEVEEGADTQDVILAAEAELHRQGRRHDTRRYKVERLS